MVGFVVGEMAFEEVEVAVDVADQAGGVGQQEHGADAAGGEAVGAFGELIMDVGGGHHGAWGFGPGSILDAAEDSPPPLSEEIAVAFAAFLGVAIAAALGESGSHSKTSEAWNSDDMCEPKLFQELRGFSSVFRVHDAETLF